MPKRKKAEIDRMQEISTGGPVTWINVTDPDAALLGRLQDKYPFLLEVDLKDCLPPFQRPKLLEREQYLFMVLLFPMYDAKGVAMVPYEVDFFLGKDFVITSHRGTHKTLAALVATCGDGSVDACVVRPGDTALKLTLDIVHGLVVSCFPLVTTLSNELIAMEEKLFEESNGGIVKEMLRLKTNIVGFRKAMQGYDNVIKKLLERSKRFFAVDELRTQYDDIIGHGREIWEFLENDRDTIDALYDSHLTLVTYKTNKATSTLTALAFMVFPMTLVAAVFGMNAQHMPLVGGTNDFWWMLSVVFLTMLPVTWFLKKKKLL